MTRTREDIECAEIRAMRDNRGRLDPGGGERESAIKLFAADFLEPTDRPCVCVCVCANVQTKRAVSLLFYYV